MKLSALFQQFHVFLPNNASVVQNIAKKKKKTIKKDDNGRQLF